MDGIANSIFIYLYLFFPRLRKKEKGRKENKIHLVIDREAQTADLTLTAKLLCCSATFLLETTVQELKLSFSGYPCFLGF